jgi:hypothetical protein
MLCRMDNLVALLIELFIGALCFVLLLWAMRTIVAAIPQNPPPALQVRAIVQVFLVLLLVIIAISFLTGVAGYWGSWGWGHHWGARAHL